MHPETSDDLAVMYEDHKDRLVWYFRRRFGIDLWVAEDLAGDVWLKLVMRRAVGHALGPALIYHMARGRSIDYLRTLHPQRSILPTDVEPFCEDEVVGHLDLHAAVRCLDHRAQCVVRARFWEGRSVQETAQVVSLSIPATKTLQSRAVDRLRRILEDETHPGAIRGI